MIAVVQFTHPGAEHSLNRDDKKAGSNIKLWNYGGHRRKYMLANGSCVVNNQVLQNQELLFWGEWEPMSKVAPISKHHGSGVLPALIQYPYLETDKNGKVLVPWNNGKFRTKKGKKFPLCRQNTDPFVFSSPFIYCWCKQGHFKVLRQLERGSIILFGSTISSKIGGPYFVVDTVFVVDKGISFNQNNYKLLPTPCDFEEIMGFNENGCWNGNSYNTICYFGASYNNPVNGMYSFVPCHKKEDVVVGFPRLRLNASIINGLVGNVVVNKNLNASPKCTMMASMNESKVLWDIISGLADKQGFLKGFDFKYNKVIAP